MTTGTQHADGLATAESTWSTSPHKRAHLTSAAVEHFEELVNREESVRMNLERWRQERERRAREVRGPSGAVAPAA